MNKHQKSILINFAIVIILTCIAVIAMINFRDWVNHSEAMLAMEQMGELVLKHRQEKGFAPSKSYVDQIKGKVDGSVRLGKMQYRAQWIGPECTEDEILAYVKKNYNSLLFGSGYIVLRLDGNVEWMDEEEFEQLLFSQQDSMEKQLSEGL